MQELIDMLRVMAGSCRQIANSSPAGVAHAVQAVQRGSLPGIRAGLSHGVMVRIVIEKENNDANSVAPATEAHAWNSLWFDPSRQGETE